MKYKRKDIEADKDNPVKLPTGVETIILSEEDSVKFIEAIENPPKPNEALMKAARKVMEQHKDTFEKLRDSDFTQTAYGMFKNKETGFWSLVEIKYDPLNLSVSQKAVETKLDDPNSGYAQERLQVLMGNTLFS